MSHVYGKKIVIRLYIKRSDDDATGCDIDHVGQLFYNSVKLSVQFVPLRGADNEYKLCILKKAADIGIGEIENCIDMVEYRRKSLLYVGLGQLFNSIRGRLNPIYLIYDEDKHAGTSRLIYKERSSKYK